MSNMNNCFKAMRDLTFFGYPGTNFFFGYPGTKFFFGYPGTNFFFGYPGIRLRDMPPCISTK